MSHKERGVSELKACPFCGGEALKAKMFDVDEKYIPSSLRFLMHNVICNNPDCLINPEVGWREDQEEAIQAWNRREHE